MRIRNDELAHSFIFIRGKWHWITGGDETHYELREATNAERLEVLSHPGLVILLDTQREYGIRAQRSINTVIEKINILNHDKVLTDAQRLDLILSCGDAISEIQKNRDLLVKLGDDATQALLRGDYQETLQRISNTVDKLQ